VHVHVCARLSGRWWQQLQRQGLARLHAALARCAPSRSRRRSARARTASTHAPHPSRANTIQTQIKHHVHPALHPPKGDIVAVELLPEDQWRAPSKVLPGGGGGAPKGGGDKEGGEEEGSEEGEGGGDDAAAAGIFQVG
jgi:hypothetical protein